jgi:hypothetical protein
MPLDPTIPLGIKQPDVAGQIGAWQQLGIQADQARTARNQAELTTATLPLSIRQSGAQATKAELEAQRERSTLSREQYQPLLTSIGSLATDPAILSYTKLSAMPDFRAQMNNPDSEASQAWLKTYRAITNARRTAVAQGTPDDVARDSVAQLIFQAAQDPASLVPELIQSLKIAQGPGASAQQMFPPNVTVDTGRGVQSALGGNEAMTGRTPLTKVGDPIGKEQPPGTVTFQDQAGNTWAIDPQSPEKAIRVGQGTPLKPAAAQPAQRETVPPNVQASRDAERLRILQGELANTTNPSDRAALQREIAKAGGAPPVMAPGEAAAEATGRTAAATDMVTHFSALNTAAEQAPMLTSQAGYIKSLIPGAVTGKLSDRKTFAVGLLNALGAGNQVTGDLEKDTNLLDKMLAQMNLVTPAATDAMRTLVSAARADRKMNPSAISEAVDQLVSVGQSARAGRDFVSSTRYANEGAGDRAAYQQQREKLDVALDPRIWQMRNMSAEKRTKMIRDDPALRRAVEAALEMKLIK